MTTVEAEQVIAGEQQANVEVDVKEASKVADAVGTQKADVEADLAEAIPALEAAVKVCLPTS